MASLSLLLLMIHLALLVTALVDCRSADERAVRSLSRRTWTFVVLLAAPVGAIAWFVRGRPVPAITLADGTVLRPAGTAPARRVRQAVAGPDDDPEFLRQLAAQLHRRAGEPGPAD